MIKKSPEPAPSRGLSLDRKNQGIPKVLEGKALGIPFSLNSRSFSVRSHQKSSFRFLPNANRAILALARKPFHPSLSAHARAQSTRILQCAQINCCQNACTQFISIYHLHRRISIFLKRILIHVVAGDGLGCAYFNSVSF